MFVIGLIGLGKMIMLYVLMLWFEIVMINIMIVEDLIEYDLFGIG